VVDLAPTAYRTHPAARIEREGDAALARYRRDRDSGAFDEAMARLDTDEHEARRPLEAEGWPAHVAVSYLRELSTTWRKADGGPGRRMLAAALVSRIEVLGAREATIHLTDAAVAHAFAAAIPDRLDVTVQNGRGERTRAHTFQLIVRIRPMRRAALARPSAPSAWATSMHARRSGAQR
jgi:hypothetical protein